MDKMGVAMMVGGMAFLFSGLIFLRPTESNLSETNELFDEDQERIEHYLRELQKRAASGGQSLPTNEVRPAPKKFQVSDE